MNRGRLELEQVERRERSNELEKLEGFSKLSREQQRLLRLSLYLEDRTNRTFALEEENYDRSIEIKDDWDCFASAFYLENNLSIPEKDPIRKHSTNLESLISEFIEGVATVPKDATLEQVEDEIKKIGFPCVAVIGTSSGTETGFDPMHVCIALGKDSHGRVMVWEKENSGRPYALLSLDVVYKKFRKYAVVWNLRPFGRKSKFLQTED